MKSIINNPIISTAVAFILLFAAQSCDSNKSQKNTALLDSAKIIFVQYDKMPNKEKLADQSKLNESITLLESVLKSEPNNPEANYFYGYALDRKLNGGVDILNFEWINLNSTKQISAPFEKLINNTTYNPEYKLSQYSKITNTWGILALNYMLKGKSDSAEYAFKTGLKLGGYRPANLEYCRNIINSLEPNAILLIDTDLETFCFWYIQYIEHLRTDVSIVSLTLLDYQWYAKWINWASNFSNPVNTNLSDQALYSVYNTANSPVADSIITIKHRETKIFNKSKSEFRFILNGRNRNNDGILLPSIDRIALAIIQANIWERPIYFSINASKALPYSLGLANNLKLEGLIARLFPEVVHIEYSVNGEVAAKRIMSEYQLAHLQNSESYNDRDIGYFSDLYKFAFIQTLYYYADYSADKDQAKLVLNKFETVFPENTFKRSNEEIELINRIRK